MKIILACDGVTLGRGGAERVAVWLANGLARSGRQITLFTVDPLRQPPVYPLDAEVSLEFYAGGGAKEAMTALRRRIKEIQPDICVVFCWHNTLLHWAVALDGTGVPLVASEHASPEFIERHSWNREDRLTGLVGSSAIHLLSRRYLPSLPDALKDRVTIIANPVRLPDSPYFPEREKKQPTLLSVGGLHYNKQRDLLIRAFALLHGRFSHWRLHIWGEGVERPALQRLIDELGLADHIRLCGETDRIFEEYRKADLFCLPSKHESFGLALAEAMAHGLPAAGFSACSGVNELIIPGTNGVLAPEMTAESLAETLAPLMADDALRRKLGANGPASVRQYAEDAIFKQWLDLFRKTAHWKQNSGEHPECQPYSYLLERYRATCTAKSFFALHDELEAIYASRAWKAVELLRRLKRFLCFRRAGRGR